MNVIMRFIIPASCLVTLLVGFPPNVIAQERPAPGPVNIKADNLSHDRASDTYRASGNVEIQWDTATLTADRASVSQQSGEAVAEGGVRLIRQGDTLKSDRLSINIETERGEVSNGDLFVAKPNLHVRGRKIAKVGVDDYRLEEGSFTTCDGESPSWKFAASDIDLTLEEYAVGRHAVFYVKDFPLFYTPWILFPVKRERQSGFFFPRIGSSTKRGFYLDLPYYWAISPSRDLTVNLDMQTRRGVGSGADYRYIRRQGSDGELRGYAIYDTGQSRFRGDFEGKLREYVSDGLAAKADVTLATDREFYQDFSVATGIYNRQLLDSSASVTKNWRNASVSGEFRYVQDLYAPDNRLTLQRLPSLNYTLLGHRLGRLPAYASLDASFHNFYREEGQKGQRLDLHPALTMYAPFPGGGLSAWGGYRSRLYHATGEEKSGGSRGAGVADAGASVTASLERVYDVQWGGVQRVKHALSPEVAYRYVEETDQESLPFFDFNDRIAGHSLLTWGVNSSLTGKVAGEGGGSDYRDLLWLRLGQEYRLSGERRDLLALTDSARPWSDIRLQARLHPTRKVSLSADSRFDPYRATFSTAAVSGDVEDGQGASAGVGYRMARGVFEYLEGRVGLGLVKPFVFNYTGRYSFDRGEFLESEYAVVYKQQCWSLTFSFRDRPDNREFLVSFTLAGIGPLGPVKAF